MTIVMAIIILFIAIIIQWSKGRLNGILTAH